MVDLNPDAKQLIMREGVLNYDRLIIGTGVIHHYFGNDHWEKDAPELKSIENALEEKQEWLTFVIVDGGATGVDLAGTIAFISCICKN